MPDKKKQSPTPMGRQAAAQGAVAETSVMSKSNANQDKSVPAPTDERLIEATLTEKAQQGDIEAIKLLAERRRDAEISEAIKQKFGVTPDKKE